MACDDTSDTKQGNIVGGQSNDEEKATVVTRKRIKGTIVKRRVLGSHLAFATVKLDNDTPLSIVFRASSFIPSDDNVFPTKKSALPFGAKVHILVQESSEATGPSWVVVEWKMLEHPSTLARQAAREKEGEGISCSKYLQARGDVFLSLREDHSEQVKPLRQPHQGNKSSTNNESNNHGRNKALRAKVFCNWLLDNMFVDKDDVVLDIAGGKGLLSMELARRAHVQCTVVDPLIRKRPNMKHLQKLQAPIPQYIAKPFYNDEETRASKMVASSTLLVGLHPDECTEDIVDVALSCGKSVAIVPCCVFPSLFSQRMLKNGKEVKSYEDFLQYLLEKDTRLQQTTLPIDGKNQVIYLKVT